MPPPPPRPAEPAGDANRVTVGAVDRAQSGALQGAIAFDTLAEIATGDTARVDLCRVLAPHRRAGALVAVKRLHPHVAEDPTFAREFLDEVWMTSSLSHPNVVEVVGWGSDEQGQYLAFELVEGVSLLRLMKTIFETGEAFTERMVVYIASRICRGLAAAHSLRAQSGELLHLVHRDLTPGNVLCGFKGEVKIADFGMAKAKQRLTKTLTGMRKGEPTYMAPEQAQTDDIDARADLFSLGVMLFELFAGRRPWIAKSDYDMVQITTREPPADLRELRPKIDKELVIVVNRCLEKAPSARWQSAHEIAARLDDWLTVHGYQEDNEEALGRFVRRNAMRQMRWFERAIAGELSNERVSRMPPPRVPTYTEHTKPPQPALDSASTGSQQVATPTPARPLVPPRPSSAAADPRSIRAANAVQQLKKLAPPVEPPRARLRRLPSLHDEDDDDGDPTDVQLRLGSAVLGSTPNGPHAPDDDDDDGGEELPTLVQKDAPELKALRAEMAASPGAIADEDSDQLITEEQRRASAKARRQSSPGPIADHESELPTAPRKPAADRAETPTSVKPPKANSAPARAVIPPSPDIPPRPYVPGTGPSLPPKGAPAPPTSNAPRPAEPTAERPSRTTARPPGTGGARADGPRPAAEANVAYSADQAKRTADDAQVIDSRARAADLVSEEAVIAEADRLSIEAVRRAEEARQAQLRAERKAAAAKVASDAAALASDALRLLRSAGLPAAIKRIEQARALEHDLQSGKISAAEVGASMRPSLPVSVPPPAGYPEAVATQPSPIFNLAAPPAPPPPPPPPSAPLAVAPGPPPPMASPSSPQAALMPAPLSHPPVPQAPIMAGPAPAASAIDLSGLPTSFQPTIMGLPRNVVLSLAAIALFVVGLLALLLAK